VQHFDKALDSLDEIFNRGLVVPSEDFNAVRQPDGRVKLNLARTLKPVEASAPTTPPPGCPCPDGLDEIYSLTDTDWPDPFAIEKLAACEWCGRNTTPESDESATYTLVLRVLVNGVAVSFSGDTDITITDEGQTFYCDQDMPADSDLKVEVVSSTATVGLQYQFFAIIL
jgi:hypothetical protein